MGAVAAQRIERPTTENACLDIGRDVEGDEIKNGEKISDITYSVSLSLTRKGTNS